MAPCGGRCCFGGVFDAEFQADSREFFHFDKIPLYNGINKVTGYGEIAIHSPQEVIEHEAATDEEDL
jgi:hypothetical protein